jgi:hypothetical protein
MKLTKAQQEIVDICRAHRSARLSHGFRSWWLYWHEGETPKERHVHHRTAPKLIKCGVFVQTLNNAVRTEYRLKEGKQ